MGVSPFSTACTLPVANVRPVLCASISAICGEGATVPNGRPHGHGPTSVGSRSLALFYSCVPR